MEFLAEGQLNQASMAMGAVESVRDGDRLAFGGVAVSVHIASDQASESTQLLSQDGARRAVFEFLPNGGQLTLTFRDGPAPFAVVLPELRARLMATLLQPPGGYTAGDLVPDDVLIPSVWPGQPHRDRTDMNVLIYRTRKSLLKAGLNPDRVLARARAGGSTRFRLAAGADVVVE